MAREGAIAEQKNDRRHGGRKTRPVKQEKPRFVIHVPEIQGWHCCFCRANQSIVRMPWLLVA